MTGKQTCLLFAKQMHINNKLTVYACTRSIDQSIKFLLHSFVTKQSDN